MLYFQPTVIDKGAGTIQSTWSCQIGHPWIFSQLRILTVHDSSGKRIFDPAILLQEKGLISKDPQREAGDDCDDDLHHCEAIHSLKLQGTTAI